MAFTFGPDDIGYLRSVAGVESCALAAGLPLSDASLLADLTTVRRTAGGFAGAVVETVRLRRRAVARLGPVAAGWLFTDEALQQATPAVVARHRAARLAAAGVIGVHDLTCSIGADLAVLSSVLPVAVGSDLDPVRLAMAAHNLAESGVAVRLTRADALTVSSRGLLGYADPARRTTTGRRLLSAETVPPVADLDLAHAARPPVLRVPPGIDYDVLARPGEVEIVSLDGVVREAVLWPAELAGPARRASVLGAGVPGAEVRGAGAARPAGAGVGVEVLESVTSDEPDDVGPGPVAEWIVDPDGAIVRAHLVRQWAARHGLWLLDPHLAYLTGPSVPPGVRGFRVFDVAPFRESVVAGWLRRDGVGTLEIKQRGTPVVPDDLRRRLRPAMSKDTAAAATLIVARVGDDQLAYWCRASTVGTGPARARPTGG